MPKKPTAKKRKLTYILIATILCAFAAGLSFWYSQTILDLSFDYSDKSLNKGYTDIFTDKENFYRKDEELARVDTIIDQIDDVFIVSSSVQGFTPEGELIFEGSGRYAVDKRTKQNIPGIGDVDRGGYFAFPPNAQKQTYRFHSPEVLEAEGDVVFEKEDQIQGLKAYVYTYDLSDLDKTQYFPNSLTGGERVVGDHSGRFWVEPRTGTILKFEHRGKNDVIDAASGDVLRPFQIWYNQYSSDDVDRRVTEATLKFKKLNWFQTTVPIAILVVWLLSIILGYIHFSYGLFGKK